MPMTKSEIAAALSLKVGISKKQVNQFFEAQADLAYKQAKNQFVIPGIGKLVLAERAAREIVMRFGPKAGQTEGAEVPHRQGRQGCDPGRQEVTHAARRVTVVSK
jgi:nucleoid DNA-binding protein